MENRSYKKSKYYPFFKEAATIYDHWGGYKLLSESIERKNIFSEKLTWKEWSLSSSVLSYFLNCENNNIGKDKRLFAISELHIKNLVHQCEKAERFPINNSLQ
jgi:hypothetical protein